MGLNVFILGLIFMASFLTTLSRGLGGAFNRVLMPVALILWGVKSFELPFLPDMSALTTVSYAAYLGMFIGGRFPQIRWHPIDTLTCISSLLISFTAASTGNLWTIVSTVGTEALCWLMPYFMARAMFMDANLRREAALILCYLCMVIAFFAAIEARLRPFFFSRTLESVGIVDTFNDMAWSRLGFFRAQVSMEHPIDLGNAGILLAAMIALLGTTSGISWRDRRLQIGFGCAIFSSLAAISFSSFAGLFVALGVAFVVLQFRSARLWLMPMLILLIVAGILMTARLLRTNAESIRPRTDDNATIEGSIYTRTIIVQRSWEFATRAGFFGYGNTIGKDDFNLESVDNSYMLFIVRRGWVFLTFFMILVISAVWIGTRMLLGPMNPAIRIPVAAVMAGLIGTLAAMYTVWFGFVYAMLWTCLLGMTVSLRQVLTAQVSQFIVAGRHRPRGFEILPPRPVLPMPATRVSPGAFVR